ncbi:MAG: hypothetical protein AAGI01_13705, partial [Myxococcota bacterium]
MAMAMAMGTSIWSRSALGVLTMLVASGCEVGCGGGDGAGFDFLGEPERVGAADLEGDSTPALMEDDPEEPTRQDMGEMPRVESTCGNGLIEPGEVCDAGALGEGSCALFGYPAGEVSCMRDCAGFVVTACQGMPDWVTVGFEECAQPCGQGFACQNAQCVELPCSGADLSRLELEAELQLERVAYTVSVSDEARAMGVDQATLVFEPRDGRRSVPRLQDPETFGTPQSLVLPRGTYDVWLRDVRAGGDEVMGRVDASPGGLVVDGPVRLDVAVPAPLDATLDVTVSAAPASRTVDRVYVSSEFEDERAWPTSLRAYPGSYVVRTRADGYALGGAPVAGEVSHDWVLTAEETAFATTVEARRVVIVPRLDGARLGASYKPRDPHVLSVLVFDVPAVEEADEFFAWAIGSGEMDIESTWALLGVAYSRSAPGRFASEDDRIAFPLLDATATHRRKVRVRGVVDFSRVTVPAAEPMTMSLNALERGFAFDPKTFVLRRDTSAPVATFDIFLQEARYSARIEFLNLANQRGVLRVAPLDDLDVATDPEPTLLVPDFSFGSSAPPETTLVTGSVLLHGAPFELEEGAEVALVWRCVAMCQRTYFSAIGEEAALQASEGGARYDIALGPGVYEVSVAGLHGEQRPFYSPKHVVHPALVVEPGVGELRRSLDIPLLTWEARVDASLFPERAALPLSLLQMKAWLSPWPSLLERTMLVPEGERELMVRVELPPGRYVWEAFEHS